MWFVDEDLLFVMFDWCCEYGVFVLMWCGIVVYYWVSWLCWICCKEGNFVYFYDWVGYDNYDFVL